MHINLIYLIEIHWAHERSGAQHPNRSFPLEKAAAVTGLTRRRGRPRKFLAPSRAITLTLPEHVIDALHAVDADLSRAVVRLTQPELAKRPHAPAELARYGQRHGWPGQAGP